MRKSQPPDASQLGDLESEVMRVVWSEERATVHDVLDKIVWDKDLAYTTIMTILTRLVDKGFLAREKEGRGFVYFPRVRQSDIAGSALKAVINRFFDGLSGMAVARLLSERDTLSDEELEELEALIRRAREERDADA